MMVLSCSAFLFIAHTNIGNSVYSTADRFIAKCAETEEQCKDYHDKIKTRQYGPFGKEVEVNVSGSYCIDLREDKNGNDS